MLVALISLALSALVLRLAVLRVAVMLVSSRKELVSLRYWCVYVWMCLRVLVVAYGIVAFSVF